MQLIRQLPDFADAPTAVAIGNFDGLHRGHKAVIEAALNAAKLSGAVPSVLTFEPHPRQFFARHAPHFRLERLASKLARLRAAGIARVYMPRFDAAFAALSAQQFLDEILGQRMGARIVVTGEDFAFGNKRSGTAETLRDWGAKQAVQVLPVPPVMVGAHACSSTAIRAAVGAGDMALAAQLLGRDYSLSGRVVHGDGRGAGLGFATANVALPTNLKLPMHGVYAVRAELDGVRHDAVANFGVRPTVANTQMPSLEVHLFDCSASLYGAKMTVHFVAMVRAERKFESLSALTAQIAVDCAAAKTNLAEHLS